MEDLLTPLNFDCPKWERFRGCSPETYEIPVMGLFPTEGAWTGGVEARLAVEMAVDEINNRSDFFHLGTDQKVRLHLHGMETACDATRANLVVAESMYRTSEEIAGVIGGGCSSVCEVFAGYAAAVHLPQGIEPLCCERWSDFADYPDTVAENFAADCNSNCLSNKTLWELLTNGVCDDGEFGFPGAYNLNCLSYNFDAGRSFIPSWNCAAYCFDAMVLPYLHLFQQLGWDRFATIHDNDHPLFTSFIDDFKLASSYSKHNSLDFQFEVTSVSFSGQRAEEELPSLLLSLQSSNFTVILWSCYEEQAQTLFRTIHRMSMEDPTFMLANEEHAWVGPGWYSDGWWQDPDVMPAAAYALLLEQNGENGPRSEHFRESYQMRATALNITSMLGQGLWEVYGALAYDGLYALAHAFNRTLAAKGYLPGAE
eukprot:gene15927-18885_t